MSDGSCLVVRGAERGWVKEREGRYVVGREEIAVGGNVKACSLRTSLQIVRTMVVLKIAASS